MSRKSDSERLLRTARDAGGTVTTNEVEQAGFSRNDLYALRDQGAFVELSRGVYRLAAAPAVSHLDFVTVCKRAPHGTICLDSALAHWDLIDDIPGRVHVAVPQGSTRPSISRPATTVHVFAPASFGVERMEEVLPTGECYWIYSAERSVIDSLRMRKRFGGGPGLEALRAYVARGSTKRRRLLELARELNVEKALLQALEILG